MTSDILCESFPSLCKAARALLGWSQEDLAKASSVSRATIADFERACRTPIPNNISAIKLAFENAGISFTSDLKSTGVSLRRSKRKN